MVTATAGAEHLAGHLDGAGDEKWAGVVEVALLVSGSKGAAKGDRCRPYRAERSPNLSGRQLFERELGNFRQVFNPQPANRNDLLGDKLSRRAVVSVFRAAEGHTDIR